METIGMLINSKGQVTIPADIRAQQGLRAGDEVEVLLEDGRIVLRPLTDSRRRAQQLVERMTGAGTANMDKTTDELMAMLRDD